MYNMYCPVFIFSVVSCFLDFSDKPAYFAILILLSENNLPSSSLLLTATLYLTFMTILLNISDCGLISQNMTFFILSDFSYHLVSLNTVEYKLKIMFECKSITTSSRIIHHVTKLQSFQIGFLNMTMS